MDTLPEALQDKIFLYQHQLRYKDVLNELLLYLCKVNWNIKWYVLKRTDTCFEDGFC